MSPGEAENGTDPTRKLREAEAEIVRLEAQLCVTTDQLGALHEAQGEWHHHVERLTSQLAEASDRQHRLQSRVTALEQSASYRIGHALLSPVRLVRRFRKR